MDDGRLVDDPWGRQPLRVERARGTAESWLACTVILLAASPAWGLLVGWGWSAFRWAAGW